MNEKELMRLKEKIDAAKNRAAELRGISSQLNKELYDNWQCKTLTEAQQKLNKMMDELETLSKQIDERSRTLSEALRAIEAGLVGERNDE